MAKLARAVHLTDPKTKRSIVLQPGEEPAPHLAALITMPSAWEGGKAPEPDQSEAEADGGDGSSGGQPDQLPDPEPEQAAPAAKKPAAKKAASTPARGRNAAAEGTSGE